MSKLDELIKKLCPNGVEYKKIGDITNYEQPSKYIVKSTDYNDIFTTPVLTAGQTFVLGYTNEATGIFQAEKSNPVIIFDDFTGAFKWVDFPFKAKSSAMKIITAKKDVLIRYLYHLMGFMNYSSSEHKRLWISIYSELAVPVPPLEVQREIVRFLDSFTLLTAELTAELTARKKQYEYYRDMLLNFNKRVEIRYAKLGDITRIFSAARVHKNEWTNSGVPFYRSSDVVSFFYGEENSRGKAFISYELYETLSARSGKPQKDDILITGGGTIGIPFVVSTDEPLYMKDADLLCIKKSDKLNSRFLYHYFLTTKFRDYLRNITHDATIAHYTIFQIESTLVPIPPMEIQNKIVGILDNFDTICTDFSIGLPAEIEARQKQYEYYRDKLLTFKELSQ